MNLMLVELANWVFSDVRESVNSKIILLALLTSSALAPLCMNNAIILSLVTFTIYHTFRRGS